MGTYSFSHLADQPLVRRLSEAVNRERATTAELLALIAEVDARRLYRQAAHPSMYSYCVHELHLAEKAAYNRIQAARTARRFPEIFTALAEGRLHLTAVVTLAPYLTHESAEELLSAATHKTRAEIERFARGAISETGPAGLRSGSHVTNLRDREPGRCRQWHRAARPEGRGTPPGGSWHGATPRAKY